MELTVQEKKDLSALVKMYKGSVVLANPKEETLKLVETILIEVQGCNRGISKLLTDLPVELLTRGMLRRYLSKVRNNAQKMQFDFKMCASTTLLIYRSPIEISGL